MRRALIWLAAAAVCGLPLAAAAKDPVYKAPRTTFGQPDITACLMTLTRSAALRLWYAPGAEPR